MIALVAYITSTLLDFLSPSGGASDEEPACQHIRAMGLISGSGRSPGGGHGNLLQYSCLENPMDREALAGYSPWGHKESDSTDVTSHACVYVL